MPRSNRTELQALRNLISEAETILATNPALSEGRTPRALELLRAALALSDDLINQAGRPAAAILGHKGGSATAQKLGSDHFRQLAAMRKKRAGGRPKRIE